MHRRQVLAGLMACPICAAAVKAQASEHAHWGYDGMKGPSHWGELSPEYAVCGSGQQQSPVDLTHAVRAETGSIVTSWKRVRNFAFKNNGHTLQADMPQGSRSHFVGRDFDLLQFHFHHQSEHTLNGQRYPMEAHFVHKAPEGDLMVLGVFLDEGAENSTLKTLWKNIPAKMDRVEIKEEIAADQLIPKDSAYYTYAGSLTTPPCSEIVTWAVYEDSMPASKGQIEAFSKLFPHNFRPRQPLNRRQLLSSSP